MEENKTEAMSSTQQASVDAVVTALRTDYNATEAIRTKVLECREEAELAVRAAQRVLATAHVSEDVRATALEATAAMKGVVAALANVEAAVPVGAYYRYHDIFKRLLQDAVCVAVVANFLTTDRLAGRELLGDAITMPLDDYLHGCCGALAELSRLCMNRVTAGDFETPARCAAFGAALFEAFKLLNFRNDALRKRFDGIKYDVKRMEEIMYDLSIRGLLPKNEIVHEPVDPKTETVQADVKMEVEVPKDKEANGEK